MTTINYDVYGHCIKCHTNLIFSEVIDGKYVERWSPLKNETKYLLDDGSQMRVCLCTPCKNNMTFSDEENKEIMKCVIRGWDRETDMLVKDNGKSGWTKEHKKKHMDFYKKKYIAMNSEKIDKKVLKKVFKNKKEKVK